MPAFARIIGELHEYADQCEHHLNLQHFAALVDRKGQILAMGTNSLHHHAEVDTINRYLSRHRVSRQWVLPSPGRTRQRITDSSKVGRQQHEERGTPEINLGGHSLV